ncbi:MAG TPA: nuclear transport factor 2 family protein [Nocardioidaceae bacterium]|nr:nuclear transport factor 2 family protein [Nocardioidaceae bacterium]
MSQAAGHESEAPEVLARWHAAVNAGDIDAALACCADDVAVQGPRGTGHGHELMRAWLTRSGIRLQPQGGPRELTGSPSSYTCVVHELAHWTAPDAPAGAPTEPVDTWCVFTVAGDLLTSVARFETRADVPA